MTILRTFVDPADSPPHPLAGRNWQSWIAPLGVVSTVCYVATLIGIAVASHRPPTYEFDPAVLYVSAGFFGALTIATLRWRRITPAHYLLPAALIALGFYSDPSTSRDPFHYLFDGALIRLHHVSPYTHVPSEFPIDQYSAVFQDTYWFHLPSPYGPVWQAVMAVINWLSGNRLAGGLMLLRGLDALALIACAHYVAAISRRPWLAYGFLLNPVMLLNTTFTPHPDIVVAAALLAAFRHRETLVRALLLAIAALIKPHVLVAAPFFERRLRRSVPLLALAAALVILMSFALQPLVHSTLRDALVAGVKASYDGYYSFLLNRFMPSSPPESISAVSFVLFAVAFAAVYLGFLLSRITSISGLTIATCLVPVILLGLVYPWHFLLGLTTLSLSASGLAAVVLLVATVLVFLAPVNLFKFTVAIGLACALYGVIRLAFSRASLVRWWTMGGAPQESGLTR